MAQSNFSLLKKIVILYLVGIVTLAFLTYNNPIQQKDLLFQINQQTHEQLHELIKTKYFRLMRLNLDRQCPLYVQNRICKYNTCNVCRCDQKDIPQNWIKTDQVQHQTGKLDVWNKQRQNQSMNWVWHVQDEQNDQGQYFDLDKNVQSFTHYNGSTIWKMIYEQNCFAGSYKYQNVCKQEMVFYKVISGLHTSVSSHLARFHKAKPSKNAQMFADLKDSDQFYFNETQYRRRVLDHPNRIQNLMFIYQIYVRAIKEIANSLNNNYTIQSDDIVEDLKATNLLKQILSKVQQYQFKPFDQELSTFFYAENPKVKQYQRYIHNISRLMNCVQCEKCRLFGKMQTYGIGTALKILLGYNNFYKRNQMVALFNAWNKISMSVDFYYKNRKTESIEIIKYDFFNIKLFGLVGFSAIIFIWLIIKIDIKGKIKKSFKNVKMPPENKKSESSIQKKSK